MVSFRREASKKTSQIAGTSQEPKSEKTRTNGQSAAKPFGEGSETKWEALVSFRDYGIIIVYETLYYKKIPMFCLQKKCFAQEKNIQHYL